MQTQSRTSYILDHTCDLLTRELELFPGTALVAQRSSHALQNRDDQACSLDLSDEDRRDYLAFSRSFARLSLQ